jgi:hypothetical protein
LLVRGKFPEDMGDGATILETGEAEFIVDLVSDEPTDSLQGAGLPLVIGAKTIGSCSVP